MKTKTLPILVLCILFFGCGKSSKEQLIIRDGFDPAVSPNNDIVAFLKIEGKYPELSLKGYIWDISEKKNIGGFGDTIISQSKLAWSPDGRKIAVAGFANTRRNIWIFDPWGKEEPIMITDYQLMRSKLLWESSDGRISFQRIQDVRNPTWSPTGEWIAFMYKDLEKSAIWRISVENRNLEQLTNGPRDDEPCFSPDGSSIIYTASSCENRDEIMEVSLKDKTTHILISSPFNERSPAWSPDGKYIAFVSDRDGSDQIWIRSLPDSLEYQFTREKEEIGCYSPTWTPDGKHIIYAKSEVGGIWMKEFDFEKLRAHPLTPLN